MNRADVKKWLKETVEDATRTKDIGCWFKWIDRTTEKHWALVMAYNPNWTVDETEREYVGDKYIDAEGHRLCVKLAYQPSNSMLQCDYDIDWLMPYDEETGDVFDTEFGVRDDVDGSFLEWMAERFETMWNDLKGECK